MKTRIRKWGNSLALRIPRTFAAEIGLREDAAVALSVVKGKLLVQPLPPAASGLKDLLNGITDSNLHDEWNTGPRVGREVW